MHAYVHNVILCSFAIVHHHIKYMLYIVLEIFVLFLQIVPRFSSTRLPAVASCHLHVDARVARCLPLTEIILSSLCQVSDALTIEKMFITRNANMNSLFIIAPLTFLDARIQTKSYILLEHFQALYIHVRGEIFSSYFAHIEFNISVSLVTWNSSKRKKKSSPSTNSLLGKLSLTIKNYSLSFQTFLIILEITCLI